MISTDWRSGSVLDVTVNLNPIVPIVSDKNGNFCIPRVLELTSHPGGSQYLDLIIYASGHEYAQIRVKSLSDSGIEIGHGKQTNRLLQTGSRIALDPLHAEEEYWKNINALDEELMQWSRPYEPGYRQELEFLVSEYELIANGFPDLALEVLSATAGIYSLGRYGVPEFEAKAIRQNEKIINRFPNSKEAEDAKEAIQEIKRNPVSENK
jgi:hypothetical protein